MQAPPPMTPTAPPPVKMNAKRYILIKQDDQGDWKPATVSEMQKKENSKVGWIMQEIAKGDILSKIPDSEDFGWEKKALSITNHFLNLTEAIPFRNCATEKSGVSWDRIDDYPGIKMRPTDLSIIKDKLMRFEYLSLDQWLDEMFLLFEIAILFNPQSHIKEVAKKLRKEFKERYASN